MKPRKEIEIQPVEVEMKIPQRDIEIYRAALEVAKHNYSNMQEHWKTLFDTSVPRIIEALAKATQTGKLTMDGTDFVCLEVIIKSYRNTVTLLSTTLEGITSKFTKRFDIN